MILAWFLEFLEGSFFLEDPLLNLIGVIDFSLAKASKQLNMLAIQSDIAKYHWILREQWSFKHLAFLTHRLGGGGVLDLNLYGDVPTK